MRSRLYLRREGEEEEPNADFRVLELKKANLARTGTTISIMWDAGVFVRTGGARQSPLSADDERIITEVEHAYLRSKPWNAHAQAHGRWLGLWIINTLGENPEGR